MDIYSILSTKPHNKHYLDRYVKFINYYISNTSKNEKTQKHHICPKSLDMFPQYSSLRIHKWNCVKLTRRQHTIAHILLKFAFPEIKSNSYACVQLINFSKISRPLFDRIRLDHTKWLRDDINGRMSVRGTTYITDGYQNKRIHLNDTFEIPVGWRIGKTSNKCLNKKITYHDPETQQEYKFKAYENIPEHLVLGRSQKFKDSVRKSSVGNLANSGKIGVTDITNNTFTFIDPKDFDSSYMVLGKTDEVKRKHKRVAIDNSGENNPCFGTKRMYNPITGENRAIKIDQVQEYVEKGFLFGNKIQNRNP